MSPESKTDPLPGSELSAIASRAANLKRRSMICSAVRSFFTARGYLEVETPVLIPSPAPEPHVEAVQAGDMFLHTSPELCMKRLLAAGYRKIFQICKCFRSDERGSLHTPEFTMLEWYHADRNYFQLMEETEALIQDIAGHLESENKILFQGHSIDLTRPWQRITVDEAFARHSRVSLETALRKGLFDEIMVSRLEPNLGIESPLFLYDYPSSMAALARTSPLDPSVAERFELYIGGLELGNGFSELTNREEQERRFTEAEKTRRSAGSPPYPTPVKFLAELPLMPDAAGMALGLDRLAMIFCDTAEIDDVIAFTPEEL